MTTMSFWNELNDQASEKIVGGYGTSYGGGRYDFKAKIDKKKLVKIDLELDVDSTVDIHGNLGEAEAFATAIGDDSLATTLTDAYADDGGSTAQSESTAAVG